MAPISPPAHNDFPEDELDQILHDIIDDPDLNDQTKTQLAANSHNQQSSEKTKADLGIDEEVTIVKKRLPIPKLDDNRCVDSLENSKYAVY
jgi:replication fork protection complex subunit Csm3/Swi3